MVLKYLLTNQTRGENNHRCAQKYRCLYCRWNVPGTVSCSLPSTLGGQANVTLSRLVGRANHVDFAFDTFKYPSINDITRDHGLVYGEVNVSGPEQGIPKYCYVPMFEQPRTSQ